MVTDYGDSDSAVNVNQTAKIQTSLLRYRQNFPQAGSKAGEQPYDNEKRLEICHK